MDFKFNIFNISIILVNIILLILYLLNNLKLTKLRKNYSDFMRKLGKGNDICEMLQNYVTQVEKINNENKEIEKYCEKLEENSKYNFKKIGMIRYNAYKDTGSNLSFAVAILNMHNTGIVLNGIYGRDSSNIYAKPIVEGTSEYLLSNEEKIAINKAINSNNNIEKS